MIDNERLAKFRRLAETDPNDELAHFTLGSMLLDSGCPEDAVPCFQRVLAINSQHSKAYQLLALAQQAGGHTEMAIQTLKDGYRIAEHRGDIVPMKLMAKMLKQLNISLPTGTEIRPASGGKYSIAPAGFCCRRCGGGLPLEKPPFKGELGEKILAGVCQTCWQQWVRMGTRVINELRLPLFEPEAQAAYDQHMKEFLLLD